jgi:hypothetical protein
MARVGLIRVAAALVPSALLLHEAVYIVAGGAEAAAHGYLAKVLPVVAVLVGSLVVAALLLPAIRAGREGQVGAGAAVFRPFAIAIALVGLFVAQEGVEIVLLGGGLGQLAAVLAGSWLLLPLALLLGALGAGVVEVLERAGACIARLIGPTPGQLHRRTSSARPASLQTRGRRTSPLAFGIARRPPPSLA